MAPYKNGMSQKRVSYLSISGRLFVMCHFVIALRGTSSLKKG